MDCGHNEQQCSPWGGPIMPGNVFTGATALPGKAGAAHFIHPGGAPIMFSDVFTWASVLLQKAEAY
eukprot:4530946-Prorocentrum_lima.AAC.1